MSAINIALLGCGTVGSRVAELLVSQRQSILHRTGFDLNLRRILVRDLSRRRIAELDDSLFTNRFADIVGDDRIDLVIEVLGGTDLACTLVGTLLARGVHVVTANKTLLANHGDELRRTAARTGAALAHEASVCAAVPILNTLRHLGGEPVRSVRGIINGSCNFILTYMASEGVELDAALSEARARGLVEPDPSADISGRDAAEKLCVLAAALGRSLRPEDVDARGIDPITLDDLRQARDWGFAVRSVATLDEAGARVGPCLVPLRHWLAGVRGERNAVVIQGEWSDELVLQGSGAGPDPTASAIIGDVISVLRGGWRVHPSEETRKRLFVQDQESPEAYFVRLNASEAQASPAHVMAVLRAHGISARRIEFRNGIVTFITDPINRSAIEMALDQMGVTMDSSFIARCWTDRQPAVEAVATNDEQEVLVSVAA